MRKLVNYGAPFLTMSFWFIGRNVLTSTHRIEMHLRIDGRRISALQNSIRIIVTAITYSNRCCQTNGRNWNAVKGTSVAHE